jgi:glycosyltransferase involved in cell wall biosynthesis
MRFLVHQEDYRIDSSEYSDEASQKLSASTSVNKLKLEFYGGLKDIGQLIQIGDETDKSELKALCLAGNTIYASMHGNPPDWLHCRFLNHSLGSFLLSGGFLRGWNLIESTVNLVTSSRQKNQMGHGLGNSCPNLGVFTPGIENELFYPSEEGKRTTSKKNFRITYSGRLIANKGIAQAVRALNFWPIPGASLQLIGDFEPDFFLYHSNACHTTFPMFFQREVIDKSPYLTISQKEAKPREGLREEYWESDCFIYPSFHEDENFGLAPREAILSGLPVIVSDFCGLGNLCNTSGFAIKTYPSLAGVRFSLRELADSLHKIKIRTREETVLNSSNDAAFVKKECDRTIAKRDLAEAIHSLMQKPVGPPPIGGWRSKDRVDRWDKSGNILFEKAVQLRNELPLDGLYVDGTGFPPEGSYFSNSHFMQAIQSLYTSLPLPPEAEKNKIYRGFWRIGLWAEENAIVEFGFPGPRVFRLSPNDFLNLKECGFQTNLGEVAFLPKKASQLILIQKLIDLGYLVPDEF